MLTSAGTGTNFLPRSKFARSASVIRRSMSRVLTRGPKVGACNICGTEGNLTEDHTPPKGCVRVTQVEMKGIVELLAAEPPGNRGRVSQNGVKYRTLCHHCNNDLLGLKFDPEFNRFVNGVSSIVKSRLHLPNTLYVSGKPQKIVRSLIGVNGYLKGPHTEDLREWFYDGNRPMPDYMKIYYWAYPYKVQVLARDSIMRDLRAEDAAYFWLMKFFPIAFWVVWDSPTGYDYSQLNSFDDYRNFGPDDEVEIPVTLASVPHERWPESPEDHRVCVFGEGAIGIFEKKPKSKRS